MAMISLRHLLDNAAEHDYGVPAFNVNNLEQIQAIMQAADQTDSPVIGRDVPAPPGRDAPGPRRQPVGVHAVDPLGLHQRDDGRLAHERRQDAVELRVQRRRDPARR